MLAETWNLGKKEHEYLVAFDNHNLLMQLSEDGFYVIYYFKLNLILKLNYAGN